MRVDMNKHDFAKILRRNQTDAEKLLWYRIRNRQLSDVKFRRQKPIENFIVDFVSPDTKLIIELDGGQHNETKDKLLDSERTKVLKSKGYKVIRFWNNEVINQLESVLKRILEELNSPHPNPLPKG